MLDDPDLTDADKTEALLRMFYVRREAMSAAGTSKNRDLVHLRPRFSKAEEELIEAWT